MIIHHRDVKFTKEFAQTVKKCRDENQPVTQRIAKFER
jgi:hypothetical protein